MHVGSVIRPREFVIKPDYDSLKKLVTVNEYFLITGRLCVVMFNS